MWLYPVNGATQRSHAASVLVAHIFDGHIIIIIYGRFSSSSVNLSQAKLNINYYNKITYYKIPKLSKYNLHNLQLHSSY